MKPPKSTNILFASLFLLLFTTCKDREVTNPFDAACPKEIFTPSDFKAEQKGAAIQLSWKQANTNISGFVINRNENDGAVTEVARIDKSFSQWSDENTTADKKYGYQLFAYAGENLSNMLTAYCTPVNKTVVVTDAVSTITSTSAVFGGSATNDNGLDITGRGVCYSTSVNPTTADIKLEMGTGSGAFSLSITGLNAGITYYARAYAITKQGTSYGSQVTFTTSFLTVSPGSYTLPKESGNKVLIVSSNTDWQVASNQSWCTLSASSGKANGSVTVTITGNTEVLQRTVILTFTGTGVDSQSVTITQAGTEPPVLTISPENQNVNNTTGTTTFAITSNVSWTATSDQGWCIITNSSGTGNATLTVNYEVNTTNTQRVANLAITGLGLSAKTVTVTQQSAIPTDGLVAYYPFNGNANDESGNGFNGEIHGATLTSDRKGNLNKAYSFNGNSNYIEIQKINGKAIQPKNEITISCFIYANPTSNSISRILRCAGVDGYILSWKQDGNNLQARFGALSVGCLDITGVPNNNYIGAWYHICVTFSSSTKILKLYANGNIVSLIGNCCYNFQYDAINLSIGGTQETESFNGKIDDIRIYNRALTEAEIQQLYKE